MEDYDDLFVDFNLKIVNNKSPEIAIKYFEDECLNRFTCCGDFSLAEVKDNSGEEIYSLNFIQINLQLPITACQTPTITMHLNYYIPSSTCNSLPIPQTLYHPSFWKKYLDSAPSA